MGEVYQPLFLFPSGYLQQEGKKRFYNDIGEINKPLILFSCGF